MFQSSFAKAIGYLLSVRNPDEAIYCQIDGIEMVLTGYGFFDDTIHLQGLIYNRPAVIIRHLNCLDPILHLGSAPGILAGKGYHIGFCGEDSQK